MGLITGLFSKSSTLLIICNSGFLSSLINLGLLGLISSFLELLKYFDILGTGIDNYLSMSHSGILWFTTSIDWLDVSSNGFKPEESGKILSIKEFGSTEWWLVSTNTWDIWLKFNLLSINSGDSLQIRLSRSKSSLLI